MPQSDRAQRGPATVRVVVGRVSKPHGVRGACVIDVRSDEPARRFAQGAAVHAGEPGNRTLRVAEQVRASGVKWVIRFEGVSTREEAALLRGAWLEADVAADELPSGSDEYFDRDLIEREVWQGTPEGTERVGTVTGVAHLPGQDLLEVLRPDGGEILIPFASSIVRPVERGSGRLVVDLPPGLVAGFRRGRCAGEGTCSGDAD